MKTTYKNTDFIANFDGNLTEEARSALDRFFTKIQTGHCLEHCERLANLWIDLEDAGLKLSEDAVLVQAETEFVNEGWHCWIELGDLVLDLTGTTDCVSKDYYYSVFKPCGKYDRFDIDTLTQKMMETLEADEVKCKFWTINQYGNGY